MIFGWRGRGSEGAPQPSKAEQERAEAEALAIELVDLAVSYLSRTTKQSLQLLYADGSNPQFPESVLTRILLCDLRHEALTAHQQAVEYDRSIGLNLMNEIHSLHFSRSKVDPNAEMMVRSRYASQYRRLAIEYLATVLQKNRDSEIRERLLELIEERSGADIAERYHRRLEAAFGQMMEVIIDFGERYREQLYDYWQKNIAFSDKGLNYDQSGTATIKIVEIESDKATVRILISLRRTDVVVNSAGLRRVLTPLFTVSAFRRKGRKLEHTSEVSNGNAALMRTMNKQNVLSGLARTHDESIISTMQAVTLTSLADQFGIAATELEASSAPAGTGTEPEAAAASEGTGSELVSGTEPTTSDNVTRIGEPTSETDQERINRIQRQIQSEEQEERW